MTAVELLPFDENAFYGALANPRITPAEIKQHAQASYLYRYLTYLKTQVIVVEREYIDGDYLDDFANYYVKSFEQFERRCTRLHFFSQQWTAKSLLDALRATTPPESLQESYLGFVVARPLPEAIIGRTELKTYPLDGDRRHYPATKTYDVHLYGTTLTVDTLAFQEQNTVLAACATVSLWSAFHKTADLFGTAAPTPAQITRAANAGVYSARPLPSKGLSLQQMARAVREVGLEPEVFQCGPTLPLLSLLVGYVELGIPPILGLHVEGVGLHAVAVAGYSIKTTTAVHKRETYSRGVPLRRIGLRVDELFVHDDGHGPFAKIEAEVQPDQTLGAIVFKGTWINPSTKTPALLTPTWVMVPVYHKIRLTFLDVQEWITRLSWVLNTMLTNPGDAEWVVSLSTTNRVKQEIKGSTLAVDEIERVLVEQQPRFVWRARMDLFGKPWVELLLDATGMARSHPFFDILFYDPGLRSRMSQVLQRPTWTGQIDNHLLDFLRRKTSAKPGQPVQP